MTRAVVSPRLMAYLLVATGLLMAGVVSGRGGLVALGAPFALAALVGASLHPSRAAAGRTAVQTLELREGDDLTWSVEMSGAPHEVVEMALVVPRGISFVDGSRAMRLRLDENGTRTERMVLRADHWGHHHLGALVLRVADPLGLVALDRFVHEPAAVSVRPGTEPLATALEPARTRMATGNHPARALGPGIEFGSIRPYQAGDAARDLNWRATARRDALMVAQHHPERSADVVLLVDTFAAEGLDETVRAALALALRQLADRDRVGLVVFGGAMKWLRLGTGSRQFDRITDALVDIRPVFSWAEKVVTAIPPRVLPVGASILAISPLVDPRAIAAVTDLRRRRYEIGVIEVAAERWAPEPTDEVSRLARRLWEMQRETLRGRLTAVGAPVVEWREGVPLELVMRQMADLTRGRGRWLAS
jgi:uncharacterized protein (DUF58 family)